MWPVFAGCSVLIGARFDGVGPVDADHGGSTNCKGQGAAMAAMRKSCRHRGHILSSLDDAQPPPVHRSGRDGADTVNPVVRAISSPC
jgi:hypothetical protein